MNRRKAFGLLIFLSIATVAMAVTACSDNDDPADSQEYKGVPLLIVDTDIGSSTDDLFALEAAYHYATEAITQFTPSATGNCRYQLPGDASWNASMLERLRSMNISFSKILLSTMR